MATAVLSNVPTVISLAESTTGWSGDSFSLEPDIKVQGGNSVACAMTGSGANNIQYATSFSVVNQHIRIWINLAFVSYIQTEALDGIQIQVISGSGTALYTVAGSDTYTGGWRQYVIYTGNTPTSGSIPSGTCTAVGLTVNTHSKPRNVPANCWVDAWYYGDGYDVTGGSNGDPIDWSHIAALDLVEAYGICTRADDIYFMAGDVKIGSGATLTWFESGQKLQFRDLPVSSTLYGITVQGLACVYIIDGGAIGAAGSQKYFYDCSDINPSLSISGVQFENSGLVHFADGQYITQCVFAACDQVDPSTSLFQNQTFSNYVGTTGAMKWTDSPINIKNCLFNNCQNSIEVVTVSTPKTFDFMTFNGGTFDVNNTSGSAVVVNLANGSNANTYNTGNSLVTFASSILLSLVVKNEAGAFVENAFAYIDDDDITPFIMNTQTNASGVATTTWTGGIVSGARWRVRLYGYKPFKVIADIGTENQSIPVTLVADPQQT